MSKSINKQQVQRMIRSLFLGFILLPLSLPVNAACQGKLALQVLGSGGPGVDRYRASSGYLLWVDGHARILLDAGGGSYARFGNSGARIEDLKLIAISHFHADHAVELPAYIKAGYFTDRQRPSLSQALQRVIAFLAPTTLCGVCSMKKGVLLPI